MKNGDYNNDELEELLSDVRKEIVGLLKSEEKSLAKAHPGQELSSEAPSDESATKPEEGGSDAPADESGPPDGPPDEGSGPPMDASAPPDDGSAPPDGSGDPGADQSMDPQALQAEYSQLPIEALQAHYMACKEALFAAMSGGGGAPGSDPSMGGSPPPGGPDSGPPPGAPDASAGPPPGGPPPGPPPGPPGMPPDAPPALKTEMGSKPTGIDPNYGTTAALDGGKGKGPLDKSENEITSLKAQLAKAESAVEKMVTFVEKIVHAPTRKAVTSVADLEASGGKTVAQLTKAEIQVKLKRVAETKLAKSDRDLIYRYDLGHIGPEQIAHLIETK